MLSVIVAHTKDLVIGLNGSMPWHLPKDLAYFKKTTLGSPVIMGRKTFESIGRALPGRLNIVISRSSNLTLPEGVLLFNSLEKAMEATKEYKEVFVIGGGRIYQSAVKLADRLYITYIDASISGDTYFPKYDVTKYRLIAQEDTPKDERNKYDLSFRVYEKI